MASQVNPQQYMADLAIKALEAGQVPWQKPWSSDGSPRNINSGTVYSGNNVWILQMTQMIHSYDRALWITFNQCKAMGGQVLKGEKCTYIFKPKMYKVKNPKPGESKTKCGGFAKIPVFNVGQCEGLELPELPTMTTGEITIDADAMFAAWPVETTHGGDRAYYRPLTDCIGLPPRERFTTASEYASTRFHEMAHSTGHASRLGREGVTDEIKFGSHTYGIEELVAEFSASVLCAMTGMALPETTDNSQAYISNWCKKIREDKSILSEAIKAAGKAVEFIVAARDAHTTQAA